MKSNYASTLRRSMRIALRWGIKWKRRFLPTAMPKLFGSLSRMTCRGALPLNRPLAGSVKGCRSTAESRRLILGRDCSEWSPAFQPAPTPTRGRNSPLLKHECLLITGIKGQGSDTPRVRSHWWGCLRSIGRAHFELLKYTAVACERRVTWSLS